jgi:hypothetical protein
VAVELELGLELVGGGPGLGESNTVLGIGVLALDVTVGVSEDGRAERGKNRPVDESGLVASTGDLEDDVVGRLGLHLERRARDGKVL